MGRDVIIILIIILSYKILMKYTNVEEGVDNNDASGNNESGNFFGKYYSMLEDTLSSGYDNSMVFYCNQILGKFYDPIQKRCNEFSDKNIPIKCKGKKENYGDRDIPCTYTILDMDSEKVECSAITERQDCDETTHCEYDTDRDTCNKKSICSFDKFKCIDANFDLKISHMESILMEFDSSIVKNPLVTVDGNHKNILIDFLSGGHISDLKLSDDFVKMKTFYENYDKVTTELYRNNNLIEHKYIHVLNNFIDTIKSNPSKTLNDGIDDIYSDIYEIYQGNTRNNSEDIDINNIIIKSNIYREVLKILLLLYYYFLARDVTREGMYLPSSACPSDNSNIMSCVYNETKDFCSYPTGVDDIDPCMELGIQECSENTSCKVHEAWDICEPGKRVMDNTCVKVPNNEYMGYYYHDTTTNNANSLLDKATYRNFNSKTDDTLQTENIETNTIQSVDTPQRCYSDNFIPPYPGAIDNNKLSVFSKNKDERCSADSDCKTNNCNDNICSDDENKNRQLIGSEPSSINIFNIKGTVPNKGDDEYFPNTKCLSCFDKNILTPKNKTFRRDINGSDNMCGIRGNYENGEDNSILSCIDRTSRRECEAPDSNDDTNKSCEWITYDYIDGPIPDSIDGKCIQHCPRKYYSENDGECSKVSRNHTPVQTSKNYKICSQRDEGNCETDNLCKKYNVKKTSIGGGDSICYPTLDDSCDGIEPSEHHENDFIKSMICNTVSIYDLISYQEDDDSFTYDMLYNNSNFADTRVQVDNSDIPIVDDEVPCWYLGKVYNDQMHTCSDCPPGTAFKIDEEYGEGECVNELTCDIYLNTQSKSYFSNDENYLDSIDDFLDTYFTNKCNCTINSKSKDGKVEDWYKPNCDKIVRDTPYECLFLNGQEDDVIPQECERLTEEFSDIIVPSGNNNIDLTLKDIGYEYYALKNTGVNTSAKIKEYILKFKQKYGDIKDKIDLCKHNGSYGICETCYDFQQMKEHTRTTDGKDCENWCEWNSPIGEQNIEGEQNVYGEQLFDGDKTVDEGENIAGGPLYHPRKTVSDKCISWGNNIQHLKNSYYPSYVENDNIDLYGIETVFGENENCIVFMEMTIAVKEDEYDRNINIPWSPNHINMFVSLNDIYRSQLEWGTSRRDGALGVSNYEELIYLDDGGKNYTIDNVPSNNTFSLYDISGLDQFEEVELYMSSNEVTDTVLADLLTDEANNGLVSSTNDQNYLKTYDMGGRRPNKPSKRFISLGDITKEQLENFTINTEFLKLRVLLDAIFNYQYTYIVDIELETEIEQNLGMTQKYTKANILYAKDGGENLREDFLRNEKVLLDTENFKTYPLNDEITTYNYIYSLSLIQRDMFRSTPVLYSKSVDEKIMFDVTKGDYFLAVCEAQPSTDLNLSWKKERIKELKALRSCMPDILYRNVRDKLSTYNISDDNIDILSHKITMRIYFSNYLFYKHLLQYQTHYFKDSKSSYYDTVIHKVVKRVKQDNKTIPACKSGDDFANLDKDNYGMNNILEFVDNPNQGPNSWMAFSSEFLCRTEYEFYNYSPECCGLGFFISNIYDSISDDRGPEMGQKEDDLIDFMREFSDLNVMTVKNIVSSSTGPSLNTITYTFKRFFGWIDELIDPMATDILNKMIENVNDVPNLKNEASEMGINKYVDDLIDYSSVVISEDTKCSVYVGNIDNMKKEVVQLSDGEKSSQGIHFYSIWPEQKELKCDGMEIQVKEDDRPYIPQTDGQRLSTLFKYKDNLFREYKQDTENISHIPLNYPSRPNNDTKTALLDKMIEICNEEDEIGVIDPEYNGQVLKDYINKNVNKDAEISSSIPVDNLECVKIDYLYDHFDFSKSDASDIVRLHPISDDKCKHMPWSQDTKCLIEETRDGSSLPVDTTDPCNGINHSICENAYWISSRAADGDAGGDMGYICGLEGNDCITMERGRHNSTENCPRTLCSEYLAEKQHKQYCNMVDPRCNPPSFTEKNESSDYEVCQFSDKEENMEFYFTGVNDKNNDDNVRLLIGSLNDYFNTEGSSEDLLSKNEYTDQNGNNDMNEWCNNNCQIISDPEFKISPSDDKYDNYNFDKVLGDYVVSETFSESIENDGISFYENLFDNINTFKYSGDYNIEDFKTLRIAATGVNGENKYNIEEKDFVTGFRDNDNLNCQKYCSSSETCESFKPTSQSSTKSGINELEKKVNHHNQDPGEGNVLNNYNNILSLTNMNSHGVGECPPFMGIDDDNKCTHYFDNKVYNYYGDEIDENQDIGNRFRQNLELFHRCEKWYGQKSDIDTSKNNFHACYDELNTRSPVLTGDIEKDRIIINNTYTENDEGINPEVCKISGEEMNSCINFVTDYIIKEKYEDMYTDVDNPREINNDKYYIETYNDPGNPTKKTNKQPFYSNYDIPPPSPLDPDLKGKYVRKYFFGEFEFGRYVDPKVWINSTEYDEDDEKTKINKYYSNAIENTETDTDTGILSNIPDFTNPTSNLWPFIDVYTLRE